MFCHTELFETVIAFLRRKTKPAICHGNSCFKEYPIGVELDCELEGSHSDHGGLSSMDGDISRATSRTAGQQEIDWCSTTFESLLTAGCEFR